MPSVIPMVDTRCWHQEIQPQLEQAALRVLRSGRFILGPELEAFEQEVAAYLGSPYAIGCANGTDALVLALSAAGIQAGDEVITTAFTFFATAEAIAQLGAIPVFVDIDLQTYNINPALISAAITPKTRAVLAVHLFGCPADLDRLQTVCTTHNLILLEDCAQSFGARYQGRHTGTFGLAGCFSFFPSKNLGGFGDGGLVTTSSSQMAEQLRQLRNHGSRRPYYHEQLGYNSRLDELQAALLRVKLKAIDSYNSQRREQARWYQDNLRDSALQLPWEPPECHHVFHQFTLQTSNRGALQEHLASQGMASAIYYPCPLYRQRPFRQGQKNGKDHDKKPLVETEKASQHCLSLPIYPGLTRTQVTMIATAVAEFLR